MKAAQFKYIRPKTIAEAARVIHELGEDAKLLAGGQSLVPSMNFRLARPDYIVDLNAVIDEHVPRNHAGHDSVAFRTTHEDIRRGRTAGTTAELMRMAVPFIAHLPIRTRGTVAGSFAHADPAAEWPVVALATGGTVTASSLAAEREIDFDVFFRGPFDTALEYDEIITQVNFRRLPETAYVAFNEFSRRRGDFALVCVAAAVEVDQMSVVKARIAVGGVASKPQRITHAESLLSGLAVSEVDLGTIVDAAKDQIRPIGDIHGSADYRLELTGVFVRRALESIFADVRSSVVS